MVIRKERLDQFRSMTIDEIENHAKETAQFIKDNHKIPEKKSQVDDAFRELLEIIEYLGRKLNENKH